MQNEYFQYAYDEAYDSARRFALYTVAIAAYGAVGVYALSSDPGIIPAVIYGVVGAYVLSIAFPGVMPTVVYGMVSGYVIWSTGCSSGAVIVIVTLIVLERTVAMLILEKQLPLEPFQDQE